MSKSARARFRKVDIFAAAGFVTVVLALFVHFAADSRVPTVRNICINNQKNLGNAIINFEGTKSRYPGWREQIGTQSAPKSGSWMFVLLPHLDRTDLYRAYGPGGLYFGKEPSETLDLLICPSDPTAEGGSALLSYAVNAGLTDARVTTFNSHMQTGDLAANGIFHDRDPWFNRPYGASAKKVTRVSSTYINEHDGTTMTILLSERIEAGRWPQYGDEDLPGENIVGILWQNDLSPPAGSLHPEARINGLTSPPAESFQNVNHVRPSSNHPGGVVVTFADGHTQFVSDPIDYLVYALMMTPNGGEARDPSTGQPVRAEFRETELTAEMLQ